jgi:nucleotide-binding universal stress UspA family protein
MGAPPSTRTPTADHMTTPPYAPAFRRILLALDAKDHGPHVASVLTDLVDRFHAEMMVVHVVFTSTSVAANASDGAPADAAESQVVHVVRMALIRWLGARGDAVAIKILHGDPGERICEYADYAGCDLIVLEGRRKTGIARRLRGSVSKYVAGNARCSVLVIGD